MDVKHPHSPLNQAHGYARIAESYEKSAKFDEARKYHQKAVEYLKKSAEIATFESTKESIRLQIEYHERQEEVVALKKLQYAVQQRLFAQKQKLMMMMEQQNELKCRDESLQWAIYKNIEAADSLIDTLAERESSKSVDDPREQGSGTAYNNGVKHPKSESTVIEELHTLNSQLRELISQLLIQLEECQKEADALRTKVKYYETLQEKKTEVKGTSEQNLIDFNSMSSSGESIGIIP